MGKNVIYRISCNECDASYMGQISRQLKTRISEHKNDINRSKPINFVLSEHRNYGISHNRNY